MTEHSNLIGGSSAERRIHCPGSFKAEEPYPNKSTIYTEEGTACHEAMEHILLNDCAVTDVIGMVFNVGNPIRPEGFKIEDGDDGLFTTKIMPAYESWLEIVEKYGELDYMVEARCDLSSVIEGAFGTVDSLALVVDDPTTKIVLDWKFGSGVPVSPYANYQCGFYATAAKHTRGDEDILEIMQGAEKIVFIIVQPERGESQWQDWGTNVQWLDAFLDITVNAVEQAKSDNPPIKPGTHCKWCKAKPDCEAQKAQAGEALKIDLKNTTAIERSYWLNKADQLDAFVKSLRNTAHEEAERGIAIPGWKLIEKRANRKFKGDTDELARALAGVVGEDEVYHDPKLKSPTQIEAVLKKLHPKTPANKKAGTTWETVYESEIADHVTKESTGTNLVRDSHKSPAVVNSSNAFAKALESVKPGTKGAH